LWKGELERLRRSNVGAFFFEAMKNRASIDFYHEVTRTHRERTQAHGITWISAANLLPLLHFSLTLTKTGLCRGASIPHKSSSASRWRIACLRFGAPMVASIGRAATTSINRAAEGFGYAARSHAANSMSTSGPAARPSAAERARPWWRRLVG
jgi:hypothetical protein